MPKWRIECVYGRVLESCSACLLMKIKPDALYMQLGQTIATIPVLPVSGPLSADVMQWLGRAAALVEASGDLADSMQFRNMANTLHGVHSRPGMMAGMTMILYRALARAELVAPASAQGSFIPVGESFSAFSAVSKVVGDAKSDVLFVDPFADHKVLTNFAVLVPRGVPVRILADGRVKQSSLKPAAHNWIKEHGGTWPLEVRQTPPKQLHDRLIIVDGAAVWSLTQSFNGIAEHSPATILKVPADIAELKLSAYTDIWQAASLL